VALGKFTGNGHELHAHEVKSLGFKPANDATNQATLNTVGLDHDKSAFHSFAPNNTLIGLWGHRLARITSVPIVLKQRQDLIWTVG
jgi:hypothetical protein